MTADLSESKHQNVPLQFDKSKRDGATRSWTSAATGRHARRGQSSRVHWTFRGAGNVRSITRAPRSCQRPLALGARWRRQDALDAGVCRSGQAGWLANGTHRWPYGGKVTAGLADAVTIAVATEKSHTDVDGADAGGVAIFIDTYERLESLDTWLREQYLPSLPAPTLIMIASRQLPSMEWRTDPAGPLCSEVLPLRNFRPEESRAYLTSRGVPEPLQAEALGFTHGNPLALSLLTDLYRLQPERFTFDILT